MPRIKVKKVEPCVTREEFEETVNTIAKMSVELEKKVADLKARHQALDDKYGDEIKRLEKDRDEQMQKAEPYFMENASALCYKGRREGATKLAKFGVRLGAPTVTKSGKFGKIAWKALGAVIEGIEGLKKFVRATPEVDREAMLAVWRDCESKNEAVSEPARADRELLRKNGFDVTQEDNFWVEPVADDQVNN